MRRWPKPGEDWTSWKPYPEAYRAWFHLQKIQKETARENRDMINTLKMEAMRRPLFEIEQKILTALLRELAWKQQVDGPFR